MQVVTDRTTLKAAQREGRRRASRRSSVSPTGKRAVFEARGEIFTVPAEHGPVLNVTRSAGVAERYPRWSPDGKTLAYWSDRSRRVRADPAARRRHRRRADATTLGRRVPLRAALVARQHAHRLHRPGDEDPHRRGRDRQGRRRSIRARCGWRTGSSRAVASLVGRLALARRGRAAPPAPATAPSSSTTPSRRRGTRSRPGTSTTPSRCSIPTASTCTSSRTATFEPVYSDFDNSWAYPNATRIVAVTAARRRAVAAGAEKRRRGRRRTRRTKDEDEGRRRRRTTGDEGRRQEGRRTRRTKRRRTSRRRSRSRSISRASRRARSCCRRRPATTAGCTP